MVVMNKVFSTTELYLKDIQSIAELDLPWEKLYSKTVLLTGATGLLGTFLVDLIMYKNKHYGANITVSAVSRSIKKLQRRFGEYFQSPFFKAVEQDVNNPLGNISADFIIHGASNTHPIAYATDPIGTIATNILGTMNVLNHAVCQRSERVAFISTVEVYGENKGDTDRFDESYLGYIDCNTLRAGYPESKRAGEALCQAFISKHNIDIVIPRLCRVYGPTMLESDSKALAQFIRNAVKREDIVLKSAGTQQFSYLYMADAVSGVLKVLLDGDKGQTYNVADELSDATLKYLAETLAALAGTKVVFQLPNEIEARGFSTASKAVMNADKLKALGWSAKYDLTHGLRNTLDILRGITSE